MTYCRRRFCLYYHLLNRVTMLAYCHVRAFSKTDHAIPSNYYCWTRWQTDTVCRCARALVKSTTCPCVIEFLRYANLGLLIIVRIFIGLSSALNLTLEFRNRITLKYITFESDVCPFQSFVNFLLLLITRDTYDWLFRLPRPLSRDV